VTVFSLFRQCMMAVPSLPVVRLAVMPDAGSPVCAFDLTWAPGVDARTEGETALRSISRFKNSRKCGIGPACGQTERDGGGQRMDQGLFEGVG